MKIKHRRSVKQFLTFLKNRRKNLLLSFSLFFIIVFVLLSFSVVYFSPKAWDLLISQELQEDQNVILDLVMKGFSWLGSVYVALIMVLIITLIFLFFRYKKEAVLMLSSLLTGAISYFLKTLIDRPRPSEDFVRIIEETHYQSFPSGHVLFYTVFFGSLIIIAVRSNILQIYMKILIVSICLTFIFFGAFSRIYLGAHWFTDVAGGFILGILFLMCTGYFYLKSKKNFEE